MEILSNFEVNLLSALGKEFDEIDVLCNTRSSLHYTRRFKESGQYRTHKQRNRIVCFGLRTLLTVAPHLICYASLECEKINHDQ